MRERTEQLRQQFQAIDTDNTGMISAVELADALKKLQFDLSDDGIKKIVDEIDFYGNGLINYSEFIAAVLSVESTLTEEQLWTLFKKFDVDNTDQISTANLREAFNRLGQFQIPEEEIDQIIHQHDTDRNGQIDFDEFKNIFTSGPSPAKQLMN